MTSTPIDQIIGYPNRFNYAITEKDCELLNRIINEEAATTEDISQEIPGLKENVLHFIIRLDPENAKRIVEEILATIQTKLQATEAALLGFVNHVDKNGKYPLDLAYENNCFEVGSILIRCGARKFSTTHLELYKEIYDLGLELKPNSFDPTNKDGWLIEYDYKNINGRTNQDTDDKCRETRELGLILDMSREQRSELMRHPLVQIFVTEKYRRYNWLINFSIIYHIMWSLMSATYILCINTTVTTQISLSSNRSTNDDFTDVEPNIANICADLKLGHHNDNNGPFSMVLVIFCIITTFKEALELLLCPSRKYYFHQFENTGQWTSVAAVISSFLYTIAPKFALVPPMTLILIIYCWKLYVKWFAPFDSYFNLSTTLDKYVIVGTFICICFMPNLESWFWGFFGIYIFGFLIIFLLLPFSEKLLSEKYTLNRISYFFQAISIFCLLCLFAYFPFEPTCTCNFSSYICAAGIAASLFLVQGQMTKTESYGVYTQMLIKGFKIISRFLFTFLPILAAYFVIFILLLPANSNFGLKNGMGIGKIVAMLTGDLGFDDVFSDERIELIPHVIPANIALTFFAVTVVLLLQNLLVGLTVNDLEKLRKKAIAAHVANRLEIIYLLENVIMFKWSLAFLGRIKLQDTVVNQFCVTVRMRNGGYEQLDQEPCKIKFWELPKPIREVIEEKQDVYVKI